MQFQVVAASSVIWTKFHGPFASDRVFELQSFPLQSDDFALLQVLAAAQTRGRVRSTPPAAPGVQGQQVKRTKIALDHLFLCREFSLIV